MLTIDGLKEFGANVEEGLARCLNNEQFYTMLVLKAVGEPGFDKLRDAVAAGDMEAGFEAAHGLKGVLGNLALTPLYVPVSELTELLRARADADYASYLNVIFEKKRELEELCK